MGVRRLRVYADTSVFGGCFDDEFAEDSKAFFDEVRAGRFTLVVSHVVIRELIDAPERVRKVLADLPPENVEQFAEEPEVAPLCQAYMDAGVVGPARREDAEHVAAASVADVDLIVSWNFHHIVHFEKINGYHGVNLIRGYASVPIYSPKEVIEP
jgi:predicted nucleic acid-binding protein